MNPEYMYMAENAFESVASVSSVSSLVGVLGYVFSALALYTIAQRRGIKKAWLAWVPVINVWILGSISDQYRYVVKDEIRSKRKVLLTVNIINWLLGTSAVIWLIATAVSIFSALMRGASDQEALRMLMGGMTTGFALLIPSMVLGIVGLVFEIMALYDLYTSCDSANNVIYLVLSIIPGISHITKPLFLFLSRNRDDGMPPRRETVENPAEF